MIWDVRQMNSIAKKANLLRRSRSQNTLSVAQNEGSLKMQPKAGVQKPPKLPEAA